MRRAAVAVLFFAAVCGFWAAEPVVAADPGAPVGRLVAVEFEDNSDCLDTAPRYGLRTVGLDGSLLPVIWPAGGIQYMDQLVFAISPSGHIALSLGNGVELITNGKAQRLTARPAGVNGLAWAPAAALVAVGTRHGLFTVNTKTHAVAKLWGRGSRPAWGPSGRIAFINEGALELVRLGARPQRVHGSPHDANDPAWSPSGSSLAYVRAGEPGHEGLFVIPAAGGTAKRIADGTMPNGLHSPTWSPDGRWLAYVHDDNAYHSRIFMVSAARGTPRPVTEEHANHLLEPKWLAPGAQLRGVGAHGADFPC